MVQELVIVSGIAIETDMKKTRLRSSALAGLAVGLQVRIERALQRRAQHEAGI